MTATITSLAKERTDEPASHTNGRGSRRPRPVAEQESAVCARFFLSKYETNVGTFELGRELPTEGEARVEALKAGLTYYSVQEWRPIADLAGKNPELKREAVKRKETTNGSEQRCNS